LQRERELPNHFQAQSDQLSAEILKGVLEGRAASSGEIAAAALVLVFDLSSATTGQTLNVDAGMTFC
jgi:enoyl-[acyl-carrier-protein] reductase (NADH)